MSENIKPTITWVNDTPTSSGKTVKVLLSHPSFQSGVSHFAYIPIGMSPEKWNVVEANTVKLGDVESDYTDKNGVTHALKGPRKQVSFFGKVNLLDGEDLPETEWTDKRTKRVESPTENGTKRSF